MSDKDDDKPPRITAGDLLRLFAAERGVVQRLRGESWSDAFRRTLRQKGSTREVIAKIPDDEDDGGGDGR